MKPRRWLAYSVEVNDLLPSYEQIVDRFEQSDVPLDGTFGSNTLSGVEMPGLLLAIGPAVEPARLAEVVDLLAGLGQLFLLVCDEPVHDKCILVGALNLEHDAVTAIAGDVLAVVRDPGATAADLRQAMEHAPKVHVLGARDLVADDG
jgi:hypothetical protein